MTEKINRNLSSEGWNTVREKKENAGYQHFLLFPHCFQKLSSSRLLKVGIVWERVNSLPNDKNIKSV